MEAGRIAAPANQLARKLLLVAVPLVFIALLIRNGGLHPSVFADEHAYSTASRHLPFADSPFPAYAYRRGPDDREGR